MTKLLLGTNPSNIMYNKMTPGDEPEQIDKSLVTYRLVSIWDFKSLNLLSTKSKSFILSKVFTSDGWLTFVQALSLTLMFHIFLNFESSLMFPIFLNFESLTVNLRTLFFNSSLFLFLTILTVELKGRFDLVMLCVRSLIWLRTSEIILLI